METNKMWLELKKTKGKIIGLTPMDGISDAVFRLLIAKCGPADVSFTEFVNIDGIYFSRDDYFKEFLYHDIERPVIAQIFGMEPKYFYLAAQIVCELGFDGLDINMGCPSKSVTGRGAGAGLIQTPLLAQEIINISKQGVADWVKAGISPDMSIRAIRKLEKTKEILKNLEVNLPDYTVAENRKSIPVSVKTRIGYFQEEVATWIPYLIATQPAVISLHGRTFKQLYAGMADWNAIAAAAKLVHDHNKAHPELDPILFFGNGDIASLDEAHEKCIQYDLDGVLVGRATWGDPWFFLPAAAKPAEQDWKTKVPYILEHVRIHASLFPEQFVSIRKHLGWYFKGFNGASDMRKRLVESSSLAEVEEIIASSNILTR